MSEVREMAIKLFGRTISFPPKEGASRVLTTPHAAPAEPCSSSEHDLASSPRNKVCSRAGDKELAGSVLSEPGQEYNTSHPTTQQLKDRESSCENPKTPSADKEHISPEDSKNDEPSENSLSQEKTLKKPEKILPCPRCNSMDTKFCYYNNYNANQPRHFCKNCQRYWTAGGNMRSVPVGSGRRKNKSACTSHYPHTIVSEVLQAANGIHCPNVRTNETVLTFGSDSPLCESIPSAFNLSEKTKTCEQKIYVSSGGRENPSITATDSEDKGGNCGIQEPVMKNCPALTPEVPCFPGMPWPTPWNSSQWSSAMPPPTFCPSVFPVTFYQTEPYWGCALPGPWNMPWYFCSGPNSSNLGKHTRDGDLLSPTNSEKDESMKGNHLERHVWVPKTLRIDDPNEATKSSIWSTLGIKNDSISREGPFKAFKLKGDEKNHRNEMSAVMQANPAALSRSLNFHESAE